MNVLTSILTLVALGLGATSLHLHFELEAARSAHAPARCRPQENLAASRLSGNAAPDRRVGEGQSAPKQSNANPSAASVAEINSGNVGTKPAAREASGSPAAPTEVTRARAAEALRHLYGRLARELALSPEQEAQVLQLLLDQQTEQLDTFRRLARDPAAMNQAMTELRDKNQTQLMTALGDKYLAFEDYQESLGERMQIEQAALQLEAAGVPLAEDQRRRLVDVMVDERDRMPRPTWTQDAAPDQALAQQREWQDDYDERVRRRLSGVLTSDQLKQYDVFRNLQATQRRRQLDAWRASSLGRAPFNSM